MSRNVFVGLIALTALVSCRKEVDDDEDGVSANVDCNDADSSIFPGAGEVCNGADDDCDFSTDEEPTDGTTFYPDADADGAGIETGAVVSCEAPAGFATAAGDCDDSDGDTFPGADEACDEQIDRNCDGSVGYADEDGDGFAACNECDDGDAAIHPGAVEVCNGADDDCDDESDEAGALGGTDWFADVDADGFGDGANSVSACEAPEGFVADDSDCDDAQAGTNPAATETCNDRDDNCNAVVDEQASDEQTWYADADGDGFGGKALSTKACAAPEGYVATATDCDDLDADTFPSAPEDCGKDVDANCDGAVGFADLDDDGFAACEECDDTNEAINPSAAEACNGSDDDCDGTVDEPQAIGALTFYQDADGDGVGTGSKTTLACAAPSGYAALPGDCDDAAATTFPSATEVCDGVDQDCDGNIDDKASDATTWYGDTDGDGFGGNTYVAVECKAPQGFVATGDDCSDLDAGSYPGAKEVPYDGVDQDCKGDSDFDADGDGQELISNGGLDCDDKDATIGKCGGDPTTAFPTCEALMVKLGSSAVDGRYYLDPDGNGTGAAAYEAYCDMTKMGGGWTLVLKSTTNNADLHYTAPIWTNGGVLNATDFSLAANSPNAKYASFNTLRVREIRIVMNGQERSFVLPSTANSLHALMTGTGTYTAMPRVQGTLLGATSFWGLTADGHEHYLCRELGVNVDFWGAGSNRARIGFQSSQEYPCSHPGTSEGIGLHEQSQNDNLGSGRLQWDAEANFFGTAFVYVRDRDASRLDGLAPATAGTTCAEIRNLFPSSPSGVYWLDPDLGDAANAFQARCDMTTNGGGWTLVLKSQNNNADFYYPSALWTNTTVLNAGNFDLGGTTNSKYRSYSETPFRELAIDMNGTFRAFTFGTTFLSVRDAMSSPAYSTAPAVAGTYWKPISYWGFNADGHEGYLCTNFGINTDFFGAGSNRARLGFQLSQEYGCGHPGTGEGVGLWEQSSNDNLGSGRLQWASEANYFSKANVWVR